MIAVDYQPEPRVRRWTKAEFYRMADLGWFDGQRAELIDGEIVVLSPQNFSHASTTHRVFKRLELAFDSGFWVRMQLPLDTGLASLPEPDSSVVRGNSNDYKDHPTASDALLVVEVSDTTLTFDRGRKAADYAAAGISDYWVVDLIHREIHVYRSPIADNTSQFGWRFSELKSYRHGQSIMPLAVTAQPIPVSDLLGQL